MVSVLVLSAFLTGSFFRSQALAKTSFDGEKLIYQEYTSEDGLVFNEVTSIYQDSRGFVWLGTYSGVSRFDGRSFQSFSKLDHKTIRDFAEDDHGRIWVALSDGLALIEASNVTRFGAESGMPEGEIVSLFGTDEGVLALFENKIVEFDGSEVKITEFNASVRASSFGRQIVRDDAGNTFFLAEEGVFQKEFNSEEISLFEEEKEGVALWKKGDGTIFLLTERAVAEISESGVKRLAESPFENPLSFFFPLPEGWWAATEDEIWHKSSNSELILSSETIGNPSISGILIDQEENLWLTTWAGLRIFPEPRARIRKIQTNSDTISRITPDGEGGLWVGGDHGLQKFSSDGEITVEEKMIYVEDLLFLPDRKVVVAASGEELFFLNQQGRKIAEISGLLEVTTISASQDPDKIWLGTYNSLYQLDVDQLLSGGSAEDSLQNFSPPPENLTAIWAILEDSDGTLWVGTEAGLWRRPPVGHWEFYEDGSVIWDFAKSPDGSLLVATSAGVLRWQSEKESFKKEAFLEDAVITALEFDNKNNLWLGTDIGIFRIEAGESKPSLYLAGSDGLPAKAVYGRALLARKEELLVGTYRGLACVDIDFPSRKRTPPALDLASVEVNDRVIAPENFIGEVLSQEKNNLSFEVFTPSFRGAQGMTFSFLLDGLEEKWSEPRPFTRTSFSNLPPGEFTFRARAIPKEGEPVELAAPFSIAAPRWHSGWIFTLMAVAIGAVVFFLERFWFCWRVRREIRRGRLVCAEKLSENLGE